MTRYTPWHSRKQKGTIMSKYASRRFWVDTFDRAVASTAQGLIASGGLDSTGLLDIDWTGVLSIAGATGLLSVLTSIAFRGKDKDKDDTEGTPRTYEGR